MGKKRKFRLPGVLAYPNTLFVVAGSLAGLAIILCMEPKKDMFQPAYEERVSLTSHWEENETVVLAGTVEEPEDVTEDVPGLTGIPEQKDAPDFPEGETDKQEELVQIEKEPDTEGTAEEPAVTEAPEEVLEESEEQAGMEQPKDLKQPEETGPPVETDQPEDSGMEDADTLPDRDVTPDEKENEPEEEIRFTENTTKKDMEDTKPTGKPEPPADTKNPDKKPEYGDDVPVAGNPENETAGKVYDPVFGWITTGEAVSDEVDNDGSLEKQVGTMGN